MNKDPRDKRYYQLQKKDKSQLTQDEIKEYLWYCEGMIKYVDYSKARKGWISLKKELLKIQN